MRVCVQWKIFGCSHNIEAVGIVISVDVVDSTECSLTIKPHYSLTGMRSNEQQHAVVVRRSKNKARIRSGKVGYDVPLGCLGKIGARRRYQAPDLRSLIEAMIWCSFDTYLTEQTRIEMLWQAYMRWRPDWVLATECSFLASSAPILSLRDTSRYASFSMTLVNTTQSVVLPQSTGRKILNVLASDQNIAAGDRDSFP